MALDQISRHDVVSFSHRVPGGGFRWVRARTRPSDKPPPSDWWLSPGPFEEVLRYRGGRTTSPLVESPALFRTFAGLDADDPDAILAFANTHGLLGLGEAAEVVPPRAKKRKQGELFLGEPASLWVVAVVALRRAVELWDLIRGQGRAGVSRLFTLRDFDEVSAVNEIVWDGVFTHVRSMKPNPLHGLGNKPVWLYDTHPDTPAGKAGPRDRFVEMLSRLDIFPPGEDPLPAALALLRRWVSERIDPELRLVEHKDTGKLVLQMVPKTLYGAMWLQLAQSITGNKTYRQCKFCGSWIEVSAAEDGRTARREFCTESCKSRDYRRRKERAQALRAEGRTPKQVAKQLAAEGLETELATVQKWVGRRTG